MSSDYSEDYKIELWNGLSIKTGLIISKMLQLNYENDIISVISGLTEEEVSIIKDTLRLNQHNVDKLIEETKEKNHLK